MASYSAATSCGSQGVFMSAAKRAVDISGEGASLYYPALLSNALAFFGAGLCWRLKKASAALNLSTAGVGLGGRESEDDGPGSANGKRSGISDKIIEGAPDPVKLLMSHVLQMNEGEAEARVVRQVGAYGSGPVYVLFVLGLKCGFFWGAD